MLYFTRYRGAEKEQAARLDCTLAVVHALFFSHRASPQPCLLVERLRSTSAAAFRDRSNTSRTMNAAAAISRNTSCRREVRRCICIGRVVNVQNGPPGWNVTGAAADLVAACTKCTRFHARGAKGRVPRRPFQQLVSARTAWDHMVTAAQAALRSALSRNRCLPAHPLALSSSSAKWSGSALARTAAAAACTS